MCVLLFWLRRTQITRSQLGSTYHSRFVRMRDQNALQTTNEFLSPLSLSVVGKLLWPSRNAAITNIRIINANKRRVVPSDRRVCVFVWVCVCVCAGLSRRWQRGGLYIWKPTMLATPSSSSGQLNKQIYAPSVCQIPLNAIVLIEERKRCCPVSHQPSAPTNHPFY